MRNRHIRMMVAALLATALAGCIDSPSPSMEPIGLASPLASIPDLLSPGPLAFDRLLYELGSAIVTDASGHPYPAQLRGVVYLPDRDGPLPIVVLLHGMHATCNTVLRGEHMQEIACPDLRPVSEPIKSFEGYAAISEALASRGYVVVGIDSNDVVGRSNDGFYLREAGRPVDGGAQARAQLVLRTLDEFARLNKAPGPEPLADRLMGRLDMSRIGLMGHSRGGEGVVEASLLNTERGGSPHGIRAVFAIGSTDFTDIAPPPDVAFAVLLPYCDGDVWSLEGAWMVQLARSRHHAAPLVQLVAAGANHNWYNTIWTQDDVAYWRADDPACGSDGGAFGFGHDRLSFPDQVRQGAAYVGAFFRWQLGGQNELQPLFTGEARATELGCADARPCPDRVAASYYAPTADRRVLLALRGDPLAAQVGVSIRGENLSVLATCAPFQCPGAIWHADGMHRLRVAWEGPSSLSFELPEGERDLQGFDTLTFLAALDPFDPRNPRGSSQDFQIVLEDDTGKRASLKASAGGDALAFPPGDSAARAILNMVGVPLIAFEGIDQSRVRQISFVFGGTYSGSVQVADLQLQRGIRGAATLPQRAVSVSTGEELWRLACSAAGATLDPAGAHDSGCYWFLHIQAPLDRFGSARIELTWDELPPGSSGVRLVVANADCDPRSLTAPCTLAEARGGTSPLVLALDRPWIVENGDTYPIIIAQADGAVPASFDVRIDASPGPPEVTPGPSNQD